MIYHITERNKFIQSLQTGKYFPDNYEKEGFIHCSTKTQVVKVANRYYGTHSDLVLLAIDTSKIEFQVKYENLEGGIELYPHIYGPISSREIKKISSLVWDGASFSFPKTWHSISEFDNMVK